ncbi:unnamed protein product [Nezara viridula]|uniref:Uncharacterized protein n=1 Tax=Nezara viridula TaxID=85310 RepID=A0A9P0HFH9_NEZVI|nr:unnamed protein product [Nezara viridula]
MEEVGINDSFVFIKEEKTDETEVSCMGDSNFSNKEEIEDENHMSNFKQEEEEPHIYYGGLTYVKHEGETLISDDGAEDSINEIEDINKSYLKAELKIDSKEHIYHHGEVKPYQCSHFGPVSCRSMRKPTVQQVTCTHQQEHFCQRMACKPDTSSVQRQRVKKFKTGTCS